MVMLTIVTPFSKAKYIRCKITILRRKEHMKFDKIMFCDYDIVRFITKSHLVAKDGSFMTMSVTTEKNLELMIFLGENETGDGYEVCVYKNKPTDKYRPHQADEVISYEENGEYAKFIFDAYYKARDFVYTLSYHHSEYNIRPVRKIKEKNN